MSVTFRVFRYTDHRSIRRLTRMLCKPDIPPAACFSPPVLAVEIRWVLVVISLRIYPESSR